MSIQDRSILEVCQSYGMKFSPGFKKDELVALCIFHKDTRPSFTINTSKNCWFCFGCQEGGGVIKLIQKKEGKTRNQVMGLGRPAKSDMSKIVAEYNYCDETGKLLYQVVRFEPKDFRQRRPGEKGRWIWNTDGVAPVLYRLDEIVKRANAQIWVTAGEKDVETLRSIGLVSTTNSGGEGHWKDEYSKWLANREVVLCGDNDEPGRKHMDQVFLSVHAYAKSIIRIELPQKYKDVSEFKDMFNTPGEFALAIGNRMSEAVPGLWYTPPKGATPEQVGYFNKAFTAAQDVLPVTPKGRRTCCDIIWIITQSFNPTTITT